LRRIAGEQRADDQPGDQGEKNTGRLRHARPL
jgi:hypothetical protein